MLLMPYLIVPAGAMSLLKLRSYLVLLKATQKRGSTPKSNQPLTLVLHHPRMLSQDQCCFMFTTTTPGQGHSKGDGNPSDEEVKTCSKEKSPACGRVVMPEKAQQTFAPEGMGMDPAEHGEWLQPGVSGYPGRYICVRQREGGSRF